jgi:hypothetical protein
MRTEREREKVSQVSRFFVTLIHFLSKTRPAHTQCHINFFSLLTLKLYCKIFFEHLIAHSCWWNSLLAWNPKVYYHDFRNPPSDTIQSQLNPIYIFTFVFLKCILILFSNLRLSFARGLVPGSHPKFYVHFHFPNACSMSHLILLDLIVVIM